ncbi:MAG: hypothetical protein IIC67_06515 [Thaumarchaeota archaeon]|nr:hypothetical protein [Nitrososphaerota archaeon]
MELTDRQEKILDILQDYRHDHGNDSFGIGILTDMIDQKLLQEDNDVLGDCYKLEGQGLIENSSASRDDFRITKKGVAYLDPISYDKMIMSLARSNIKYTKVAIAIGTIVLVISIISIIPK